MTVYKKVLLSLLVSAVFFAGAAAAAYTGLFDVIETRFYNPSITKFMQRETARDAEVVQGLLYDLHDQFASSLGSQAVRRSFLPAPAAEDVFARSRRFGLLLKSVAGLQSVRFVDSSGSAILFSTWKDDVAATDGAHAVYRPYGSSSPDLPFADVYVPAGGHFKLLLEPERVVFSFPFDDAFGIYQGTAVFTLAENAVSDCLVSAGRLKPGDNVAMTASPSGIVRGLPSVSGDETLAAVSSAWGGGLSGFALLALERGNTLALFSAKTSQGVFCGRLVNGDILVFPLPMKIILLASFFLTVYLAAFFCMNIKADPLTVVQNRFGRLKNSLLDRFYECEGDTGRKRWAAEIGQWQEGLRAEIKRGIRFGKGRYSEKNADALIDREWNELLSLTGGMAGGLAEKNPYNSHNAHNAQNRVLETSATNAPPPANDMPFEDAGELEELEAVEEHGSKTDETAAAPKAYVRRGAALPEDEPRLEKSGGLLSAAAQKQLLEHAKNVKIKSNVRIAFDGDDIPYIVESSGLEIVNDEDIDDAINAIQKNGGALASRLASVDTSSPPAQTLAEISSRIEFGGFSETASGAEEAGTIAAAPLEVVSPFASMFSPLEAAEEQQPDGASPEEDSSLIENASLASGLPITHRPFKDTVLLEPALLESVPDEEPETPVQVQGGGDVIIQQDGIHYINDSIVNNYDRENLNSEFRELVDSVVLRT